MGVLRRAELALVGFALIALSVGLVALCGLGFTTTFAKTGVACGAPVAEAWPEEKPRGPSEEEAEYLLRTANWAAAERYDQDAIRYFEARACGSTARSRLWKYGLGAAVAALAGSAVLRRSFRRRPKEQLALRHP